MCERGDWLKVRYESGHTLVGGRLFSMRFRDASFQDWFWVNLDGFDVTREKPGEGSALDVGGIGAKGDDSLFSWVVRRWPSGVKRRPEGWLACDDGAGEIADFVHFDPKQSVLTLIHVKASGTKERGRQLSTSDYEVVVGQAIKNLRSLDRENLIDRLQEGSQKTVASAVWKGGVRQRDRTGFIGDLRRASGVRAGRVVVLQPRVTKGELERVRADERSGVETSRVARMRQLDALLLEARAACRDLGAELRVLGEDV